MLLMQLNNLIIILFKTNWFDLFNLKFFIIYNERFT